MRPPLYVAFLSLFVRAWGTDLLPVTLVQSALSALTLLPLGMLAARLGGLRAARWTVALGALYLPFTLFSGLLLSETLFLVFFAFLPLALVHAASLPPDAARAKTGWAASAGLLLGLCAVTRSTALGFLPLAAVWLFFVAGSRTLPRRLQPAVVFVGACLLVMLPWVARNYVVYHRLIAIDTTAGYNLWLGSVGVRDEERLVNDLRPLSGPIERQDFAFARAWENISSDPAFFVRKGLKESADLWRPLFSAEERQVSGYTLGRVPAWHLLSLLALDDLLYMVVLVLGVAALFLLRGGPLRSLTVLWVLLWVVMSFIFFAVTRFRLPVVASLLPWAGLSLARVPALVGGRRSLHISSLGPRLAGAALVIVVLLVIIVPAVPVEATATGVARSLEQAPFRQAEADLLAGRVDEAIANYRRANLGLADTRYGLAAALLQKGDTPGALEQFISNEPADRFEPYIIRGEAARLAGDQEAARTLLNTRVVKLAGDAALSWAWDHLRPAPVGTIAIGSGLDIGYIRGFYAPETDEKGQAFRWSAESSQIRGLRGAPSVVGTWSGWRPSALPQAVVRLYTGTQEQTASLNNSKQWTQTTISPGSGGAGASISLNVGGFVSGGSDGRLLGVRVLAVTAK